MTGKRIWWIIYITLKSVTFWNDDTFTLTSSVQGLPVILKWHNLQSLDKALDLFIEFEFCENVFYFLNRSKNCVVVTYNFGSVHSALHYQIDKTRCDKGIKSLASLAFSCYLFSSTRLINSIKHQRSYMYKILCIYTSTHEKGAHVFSWTNVDVVSLVCKDEIHL